MSKHLYTDITYFMVQLNQIADDSVVVTCRSLKVCRRIRVGHLSI